MHSDLNNQRRKSWVPVIVLAAVSYITQIVGIITLTFAITIEKHSFGGLLGFAGVLSFLKGSGLDYGGIGLNVQKVVVCHIVGIVSLFVAVITLIVCIILAAVTSKANGGLRKAGAYPGPQNVPGNRMQPGNQGAGNNRQPIPQNREPNGPRVYSKSGGTLLCTGGTYEGADFPIRSGEEIAVGSDPSRCNIVLGDRKSGISGLHFILRLSDDGMTYYITDYSTNGTRVNGRRLTKGAQTQLNSGTVITLGSGPDSFRLG